MHRGVSIGREMKSPLINPYAVSTMNCARKTTHTSHRWWLRVPWVFCCSVVPVSDFIECTAFVWFVVCLFVKPVVLFQLRNVFACDSGDVEHLP